MPELEDPPGRDPVDLLAQEFADRCRRGEKPAIEEYAEKHPEIADSIRQLFPAVAFLERSKPAKGRSSGSGSRLSLSGSGEIFALPIRRLGGFRILRELGRGGMGIVYEAEEETLGRRVAVKVLPGHAAFDATSRKRFLREASAAARLEHPNIVPIFSVGEEGGLPYYVMPLIEGSSLDRLIAEGRSADPRWVADLGRQAAQALAFAHERGVLHRDIKPANLLLDPQGTLRLTDFGLAKMADDLSLTGTGDLPGTLRYLAPECLQGEGDARGDIYGLGLTLYELLVGEPAFPESNRARLLRQVHEHSPPSPRSRVPGIPRDLETIVLKATAREPSARYASASALADDLGRFLNGRPIRARRLSPAGRMVLWTKRNSMVAALTGTSLALGLIAISFVFLYMRTPSHSSESTNANAAKPISVPAEEAKPTLLPSEEVETTPRPPEKGFRGDMLPPPPPFGGPEGRRPPPKDGPPPRRDPNGRGPDGHRLPPPPRGGGPGGPGPGPPRRNPPPGDFDGPMGGPGR